MFLLGSVILGPLMCIFDFGRSGAVTTNCVHVDKDPEWFLRVLLRFAYANSAEMGTDPTVELDSDMNTGRIKVGKKWYHIKDVLHVEGVIRGRGTVVYRVSNPDDDGDWTEGIVKDYWSDTSRDETEKDILHKLRHIQGILRIIKHWEVEDENGKQQTTASHRKGLFNEEVVDGKCRNVWKLEENAPIEIREHRQMLAVPLGLPLQHFSSRAELLRIFDDVAESTCLFVVAGCSI